MGELQADIHYSRLKEEEMDLGGGVKLTTKYLNHPITVLGYKFEYQGKVLCTAYDHEPFGNIFDVSPNDPSYNEEAVREGAVAAKEENDKVEAFFRGADILVHDSQYTQKEYRKDKKGWGHSSFEWAIKSALRAHVKHLVLFHHEPLRTDEQLEKLYRELIGQLKMKKVTMTVSLAQEGTTIEV
jgi:hypothetical protein